MFWIEVRKCKLNLGSKRPRFIFHFRTSVREKSQTEVWKWKTNLGLIKPRFENENWTSVQKNRGSFFIFKPRFRNENQTGVQKSIFFFQSGTDTQHRKSNLGWFKPRFHYVRHNVKISLHVLCFVFEKCSGVQRNTLGT